LCVRAARAFAFSFEMLSHEQCVDAWNAAGGEAFVDANGPRVVVWRAAAQCAYTLYTHEQFRAGPLLTLDAECKAGVEAELRPAMASGEAVFCTLVPSESWILRRLLGDHYDAEMQCWRWQPPPPEHTSSRLRRSGRLRTRSPK